jgi:hypothetical protein
VVCFLIEYELTLFLYFKDGAIHLYPMHDFASFVQNQTTCSSKSHSLSDQQNLSTVTSFGSWLQNPVIGDDLEAIHADIETYQLVSGHHKGKLKLFDLHKCVLLEVCMRDTFCCSTLFVISLN